MRGQLRFPDLVLFAAVVLLLTAATWGIGWGVGRLARGPARGFVGYSMDRDFEAPAHVLRGDNHQAMSR